MRWKRHLQSSNRRIANHFHHTTEKIVNAKVCVVSSKYETRGHPVTACSLWPQIDVSIVDFSEFSNVPNLCQIWSDWLPKLCFQWILTSWTHFVIQGVIHNVNSKFWTFNFIDFVRAYKLYKIDCFKSVTYMCIFRKSRTSVLRVLNLSTFWEQIHTNINKWLWRSKIAPNLPIVLKNHQLSNCYLPLLWRVGKDMSMIDGTRLGIRVDIKK